MADELVESLHMEIEDAFMQVLMFVRNLRTDDEVRSNPSFVDYPKCIFFARLIDRLLDPYSDPIEESE